jgi:hypothetical protein
VLIQHKARARPSSLRGTTFETTDRTELPCRLVTASRRVAHGGEDRVQALAILRPSAGTADSGLPKTGLPASALVLIQHKVVVSQRAEVLACCTDRDCDLVDLAPRECPDVEEEATVTDDSDDRRVADAERVEELLLDRAREAR